MTAPRGRGTLRRMLVLTAVLASAFAAAAMIGSLTLATSLREAVERDNDAFTIEQALADQIGAHTYEQQLATYRFLQRPDSAYLLAFHAAGDRAYSEIRGYLFHELSTDARLQVETIKETHQQFEVTAERVFDLVRQGRLDTARGRLWTLERPASELDVAVRRFREARSRQRVAFREQHDVLAERLRYGLGAVAGALLLAFVALAMMLRSRVLRPLDQLAAAARSLGEGDTTARVGPQRYGEFDTVAAGFNQMADRVHAERAKLVWEHEALQAALANLQRTQEELVQHEKLSAMGQMLAGLAHELNNPLAGILGLAQCLRMELAETEHAEVREVGMTLAVPLEAEALRARALVRSLLSFARKPSGTNDRVNVADAVNIAIGLRAHAFSQAGKTLQVEVPADLEVWVDAQKLQHAVVNIVNNALDAVIGGQGQGLRIRAARADDGFVRMDFDDDGPGLSDPVAAFAPFYTTKKPGEGTGLGLALVQRFIAESGGTVSASNPPGGGARISIRLREWRGAPEDVGPGAASGLDGEDDHRDAWRLAEPAFAPGGAEPHPTTDISGGTGRNSRRSRVLVVDDEPAIREIQRRLLLRAGVEVLVASSGESARDMLLSEDVDLVVTDLRMPGEMDGAGLLAWLRQERPRLASTALLVTGHVSEELGRALPFPANQILGKPFEAAVYLRRVRLALAAVEVE